MSSYGAVVLQKRGNLLLSIGELLPQLFVFLGKIEVVLGQGGYLFSLE